MPGPIYVQGVTNPTPGYAPDLTLTLGSTPTVGNIMVAICCVGGGATTISVATGWTLQATGGPFANTHKILIATRVVQAGDTTAQKPFTGTGNCGGDACVYEFSNATISGIAFTGTHGSGGGDNGLVSFTTTSPDNIALYAATEFTCGAHHTQNLSGSTWTNQTSMTSGSGSFGAGTFAAPTSGTTVNGQTSNGISYASAMIVLGPPPSTDYAPGHGSIILSSNAPDVIQIAGPDPGSIILTGETPMIAAPVFSPGVGHIVLAGENPAALQLIETDPGSIILTGKRPMLNGDYLVGPGLITLSGQIPVPVQVISVPPGHIVLSGATPNLAQNVPPIFDPLAAVISQYANSPIILALIESFAAAEDPTGAINDFYNLVWNVLSAQGYGLDVWGRIVGVGRVIQLPSGDFFSFNNAGNPGVGNFGGGPFFSGDEFTNNFSLLDPAYLQLILAKAAANICDGSIPAINEILMALFPGLGNCYVTDGGDMTMTYTFGGTLSPVDHAIITQTGVLPKPVGVALSVVEL